MSRAINIDASVKDLELLCQNHAFRISTIEPLASGGSRVVLLDPRDAECVRILMKDRLIAGPITRSRAHIMRQPLARR